MLIESLRRIFPGMEWARRAIWTIVIGCICLSMALDLGAYGSQFYLCATLIVIAGAVFVVQGDWFSRRFVPELRPESLAVIRILVGLVLLLLIFTTEDLPSSALLPDSLRWGMGLFSWLYLIPGFHWAMGSVAALNVIETVTVLALLGVVLGWRVRVTLPLAFIGFFIIAGAIRHYTKFYHTGLTPMLLLLVLMCFPCADAFSVSRRQKPVRSLKTYGWGVYCIWAVIAIPYVTAGLNKLRYGGTWWWDASNVQGMLLITTMEPMAFDFDGALLLMQAPPWVVSILGFIVVAGEILMGTTLFSRKARMVFPAIMFMMHVGILVLQNILFLDMILLQAVFYVELFKLRPGTAHATNLGATRLGAPICAVAIALFATSWCYKIEHFPLSSSPMFAGRVSEQGVVYIELVQEHADGQLQRAYPERELPVLSDTRYRFVIDKVFGKARSQKTAYEFLQGWVARYNDKHPDNPIVRLYISRKLWDYQKEPDSATRVTRQQVVRMEIDPVLSTKDQAN